MISINKYPLWIALCLLPITLNQNIFNDDVLKFYQEDINIIYKTFYQYQWMDNHEGEILIHENHTYIFPALQLSMINKTYGYNISNHHVFLSISESFSLDELLHNNQPTIITNNLQPYIKKIPEISTLTNNTLQSLPWEIIGYCPPLNYWYFNDGTIIFVNKFLNNTNNNFFFNYSIDTPYNYQCSMGNQMISLMKIINEALPQNNDLYQCNIVNTQLKCKPQLNIDILLLFSSYIKNFSMKIKNNLLIFEDNTYIILNNFVKNLPWKISNNIHKNKNPQYFFWNYNSLPWVSSWVPYNNINQDNRIIPVDSLFNKMEDVLAYSSVTSGVYLNNHTVIYLNNGLMENYNQPMDNLNNIFFNDEKYIVGQLLNEITNYLDLLWYLDSNNQYQNKKNPLRFLTDLWDNLFLSYCGVSGKLYSINGIVFFLKHITTFQGISLITPITFNNWEDCIIPHQYYDFIDQIIDYNKNIPVGSFIDNFIIYNWANDTNKFFYGQSIRLTFQHQLLYSQNNYNILTFQDGFYINAQGLLGQNLILYIYKTFFYNKISPNSIILGENYLKTLGFIMVSIELNNHNLLRISYTNPWTNKLYRDNLFLNNVYEYNWNYQPLQLPLYKNFEFHPLNIEDINHLKSLLDKFNNITLGVNLFNEFLIKLLNEKIFNDIPYNYPIFAYDLNNQLLYLSNGQLLKFSKIIGNYDHIDNGLNNLPNYDPQILLLNKLNYLFDNYIYHLNYRSNLYFINNDRLPFWQFIYDNFPEVIGLCQSNIYLNNGLILFVNNILSNKNLHINSWMKKDFNYSNCGLGNQFNRLLDYSTENLPKNLTIVNDTLYNSYKKFNIIKFFKPSEYLYFSGNNSLTYEYSYNISQLNFYDNSKFFLDRIITYINTYN